MTRARNIRFFLTISYRDQPWPGAYSLQMTTDDDLLSALQNDDPAFLMGLTRLDLLDFSGLT
jgi:hypothetical protein